MENYSGISNVKKATGDENKQADSRLFLEIKQTEKN
jgi:hypothetical protein